MIFSQLVPLHSPVVGQLQRYLYESIRAHAEGFGHIFAKVLKHHHPHVHVLSQPAEGSDVHVKDTTAGLLCA